MRLRNVGPGIGGLNYGPLLRNSNERAMRRALDRLPQQDAATASMPGFWHSVRAIARRMGQRLAEARMAEARRLIQRESVSYHDSDGPRFDRASIGSRYY